MGVFIQWCPPHDEAPYDEARVQRGTAEAGPWVTVQTQASTDTTWYDLVGTSSSWYRVQFFDVETSTPSSWSAAVPPGTLLGYCTPEDLRNFTNLDSTDLSDEDFCQIIPYAGAQLNHDIQIARDKEVVKHISATKQNKIDGTNATFYTQHFPMGDRSSDMEVTTSDITVYAIDSEGVRTTLTVDTINANTGQFDLALAPGPSSVSKIEIDYVSASLSVSGPHPLITLACIYLVASIAYAKVNVGKSTTIKLGAQAFVRHMKSYREYYQKYQMIVGQINNRMADSDEGVELLLSFGVGKYY